MVRPRGRDEGTAAISSPMFWRVVHPPLRSMGVCHATRTFDFLSTSPAPTAVQECTLALPCLAAPRATCEPITRSGRAGRGRQPRVKAVANCARNRRLCLYSALVCRVGNIATSQRVNMGNKTKPAVAGVVTAALMFVVVLFVLPGGPVFALVLAAVVGGAAFFGFVRADRNAPGRGGAATGTAGDYLWDERQQVWTRFDGKRPRRAIVSANLSALSVPQAIESQPPAADATREKALEKAIEEAVMAGSAVMQKGQLSAILSQKKPLNHGLHIFLSVVTLGTWLTPYLIIAVTRGDIRYRLEADNWGHVWPVMV